MAGKRENPKLIPENTGTFRGLANQLKLIMKLLVDPRISPILKILPIGSLIYLLIPTDLMPGLPIDDALIIGIGSVMFVELCPPDIVEEHREAIMHSVDSNWQNPPTDSSDPKISEEDIIEGEYREKN